MSVLEGPRKEIRHVMKDGSAYWVEFKDGKIVFDMASLAPRCRAMRAGNDS